MSAVISDAAFEREMSAAYLGVDQKIFYTKWHQEEPAKPFREMLCHMTRLREEAEEEDARRAEADWAYEASEPEPEPDAKYELFPCRTCRKPVELGACRDCHLAEEAYHAFRDYMCALCRRHKADDSLCEHCHPKAEAGEGAATAAPPARAPTTTKSQETCPPPPCAAPAQ
jgi:hypothetical protein